MSEDLRDYYRAALERVARSAGVTPEEFEESLQRNFESLEITSDCLTQEEIEALCSGQFPAPERGRHLEECHFCCALLKAINTESRPENVRKFIEMVTGQTYLPRS